MYVWSTFIQLHFAFPYYSPELRPLIYVQNVFLPNIFQINGYISRNFYIDNGIAEEWYGIASGLMKFRNNWVQKQQRYEQS